MFVEPKLDCPHIQSINFKQIAKNLTYSKLTEVCEVCKTSSDSKKSLSQENWLCLSCQVCLCSRYVKGHMLEHIENEKNKRLTSSSSSSSSSSSTSPSDDHCVAFSLVDASFWCFECDSYIYGSAPRNFSLNVQDIIENEKDNESEIF